MAFQDSAVPDLLTAISSQGWQDPALPAVLANLETTAMKSGQKLIAPFAPSKQLQASRSWKVINALLAINNAEDEIFKEGIMCLRASTILTSDFCQNYVSS